MTAQTSEFNARASEITDAASRHVAGCAECRAGRPDDDLWLCPRLHRILATLAPLYEGRRRWDCE